ncbi:MAG TPA: ribose 5-phosphate isomerase B [Candidatus Wallbacteria bacterium]|nr:ribose 5-phosphate isomerase B [Candidatus Wallbacteria bacterium]
MEKGLKLAIGSDHGGAKLKNEILEYIRKELKDHTAEDFGGSESVSSDYPDMAARVCEKVVSGEYDMGILFCGTGQGMAIYANKVAGIRAVCVTDPTVARFTREHNDANVLCLGGRISGFEIAADIVKTFIGTRFAGGRHQRRVDKINDREKR